MIHRAYGGSQDEPELIPGEISKNGTLKKWHVNGVIVACLNDDSYVYDPELRISETSATRDITHVIWDDSKATFSGSGTWRYLSVKPA